MDSQSSIGVGAVMRRPALFIKPKISLILCLFFFFVYSLSFIVCVFSHIPLWLHFFLGTAIILHFFYVLRRYVFYRHPLSVRCLWCDDQDHWRMQYRDAHVRSIELFQSIMVSRYLIFMSFRVPGRFFPIALPLALDSGDSESMQRLRRTLLKSD